MHLIVGQTWKKCRDSLAIMALLIGLQFTVLILFLALHAVNADTTTFDLLDLLTSEKNGMYCTCLPTYMIRNIVICPSDNSNYYRFFSYKCGCAITRAISGTNNGTNDGTFGRAYRFAHTLTNTNTNARTKSTIGPTCGKSGVHKL